MFRHHRGTTWVVFCQQAVTNIEAAKKLVDSLNGLLFAIGALGLVIGPVVRPLWRC